MLEQVAARRALEPVFGHSHKTNLPSGNGVHADQRFWTNCGARRQRGNENRSTSGVLSLGADQGKESILEVGP
jgi:hypothetical protein